MTASASFSATGANDSFEVLWEDTERSFCRLRRDDAKVPRHAFIPALSGADHPTLESINRLTHEYELKDYLDTAWALRPVELVRDPGRPMLVVEYAGGEPLDRLTRQPMEIGRFLRLGRGLPHADSRHRGLRDRRLRERGAHGALTENCCRSICPIGLIPQGMSFVRFYRGSEL